MPAILVALASLLSSIAGHLAGRVVLALGFQYVIYQGISAVLGGFEGMALGALGSGPMVEIERLIDTLQIGSAMSMVFAAVGVRMALSGLTSGTVTKMVLK